MNDRYRLDGLEDDQLLASLSGLVRRENDSLSDLLAHLAELDERGICIALGYSSLFAYCTEALRFCKSSAGRRIAAARVCREYPEAFIRVAKGELQLSVLCALRPHLNAKNANDLFAACSRKSYEQLEELLAARFPKPDVRDLIRRLPGTAVSTPDIGTQRRENGSEASRGGPGARLTESRHPPLAPPLSTDADHRQAAAHGTTDRVLATVSGLPGESPRRQTPHGAVKPLSADRFSVNFTADGEFRELLEEVRALLSHAEPKGDLMRVMTRGLEALRSELLKKRFGVGRKPRCVRPRTSEPQAAAEGAGTAEPQVKAGRSNRAPQSRTAKLTRHVAAVVAREVYVRDQGRCTFCADDGRRCGERHLLQLDHIVPHSQAGEATAAKLRLRCRTHNLHTAQEHFGKEYVRSAAERTRKRARRVRSDKQRHDRPAPGQL